MVSAINSTDSARVCAAIEEFLHVRAFIRFVAVEAFLSEQDGVVGEWGMNNFYLYRPPQLNRFTILPWDKSQAFVSGTFLSIWHNIQDVAEPARNRLLTRLLQYPDLRDLYLDTVLEAAASASALEPGDRRGWLEREIDREVLQIRDAVFADTTKPFSNEAFDADVAMLKAFAQQRPDVVRAEVARSRGTSRAF